MTKDQGWKVIISTQMMRRLINQEKRFTVDVLTALIILKITKCV